MNSDIVTMAENKTRRIKTFTAKNNNQTDENGHQHNRKQRFTRQIQRPDGIQKARELALKKLNLNILPKENSVFCFAWPPKYYLTLKPEIPSLTP